MIERVVFMGTPRFAVPALEAIAGAFRVVGVYTQPDRAVGRGLATAACPVKIAALSRSLPVFQPEKLSAPGEFEKLAALKPDAIVVAAYGQILRRNVLDLPRYGCINIHSSLLPRWRGAAPIQWAIMAGDRKTGVTTMRMAEGLDTGPALFQSETPIAPEETGETLHDRLSAMGADLIVKTLQALQSGTAIETPQADDAATYARKLTKEMGQLAASETAVELERKIRAFTPWPGTSISLEGLGRLKILEARAHADLQGPPTGTVDQRNGMVLLGTAAGSLEIKRMQWEGKSPIGVVEFLNGMKGRGQALPLRLSSGSK